MGVDLKRELEQQKKRSERKSVDEVLMAYKALLEADDKLDEEIIQRIFETSAMAGNYQLHRLDECRIFNEKDIRKLCTAYRLRFLEASLFKAEIPYEAIFEIKKLEKEQEVVLSDFKILAPAPMFNLERKDRDPLLFLNLGNQHYYLIYKWGRDLHPLRKLLVFPFRNFKTLLTTVMSFAFVISMMVPDSVIATDGSNGVIRGILFFYLFFAFSALTILYGFSRMKDFNSNLWNSRYTD